MMREKEAQITLASIMLCDAATSRDQLLNVLGGGITLLTRDEFPSTVQAFAVVAIQVDGGLAPGLLAIRFLDRDSEESVIDALEISVNVQEMLPGFEPGNSAMLPFVMDMNMADLPRPGRFKIAAFWDDVLLGEFRFAARLPA